MSTMVDDLSSAENAIMLGLIRDGVSKAHRTRSRGARRWGEAYDPSAVDRRLEQLKSMYSKLGGDPQILMRVMGGHDDG